MELAVGRGSGAVGGPARLARSSSAGLAAAAAADLSRWRRFIIDSCGNGTGWRRTSPPRGGRAGWAEAARSPSGRGAFNGLLVPGYAGTDRLANQGHAVPDLKGIGEDRIPPVGVLQPVGR